MRTNDHLAKVDDVLSRATTACRDGSIERDVAGRERLAAVVTSTMFELSAWLQEASREQGEEEGPDADDT